MVKANYFVAFHPHKDKVFAKMSLEVQFLELDFMEKGISAL